MRHGMANKKLNRTSEHRKALLKNMLKFFNKIWTDYYNTSKS